MTQIWSISEKLMVLTCPIGFSAFALARYYSHIYKDTFLLHLQQCPIFRPSSFKTKPQQRAKHHAED